MHILYQIDVDVREKGMRFQNYKVTAGVLYRAAAVFFIIYLLVEPVVVYNGAVQGLQLWYQNIVPVQFPFYIAVSMLRVSGCLDLFAGILRPAAKRLFHISEAAIPAVVVGWISGYPMGVSTASSLYQQKRITKEEYLHVSLFSSVPGPLFVITTVGERLMGSVKIGYAMVTAQFIASIVCAILLRPKKTSKDISWTHTIRENISLGRIIKEAVQESAGTLVTVGGCIVLFSVIMMGLPETPVTAMLEMANGCRILAGYESMWAIGGMGFLLGWGGACIQMQLASVMDPKASLPGKYWIYRLLQGFLAAVCSAFLTGFLNI